MSKILRRLTNRRATNEPPATSTDLGETTGQCIELLNRSLEAWMAVSDDDTLKEISKRVDSLWLLVLDPSKQVAPQRKFMLAEQLVTCSDVMKRLLYVICYCDDDMKRKIRDVLRFLDTWASNDNPQCSVPRKNFSRTPAKFNALLFRARFESYHIITEGMSRWNSASIFIDIIRIFAKDHDCLMAILNDDGKNSKGEQTREEGCVWSLFKRLLDLPMNSALHVAFELFQLVEVLFLSNHAAIHEFLTDHPQRFIQTFNKLIAAQNFYIQAKSLKFVYEILSNREHRALRIEWMSDPNLLKAICHAIQSVTKAVRKEAALILNLFVMDPDSAPEINEFLGKNRNLLLDYCFFRIPFSAYPIAPSEEWFAEPAYHLIKREYGSITPKDGKMTNFHTAYLLYYDRNFKYLPDRTPNEAILMDAVKIPKFHLKISSMARLTANQPRGNDLGKPLNQID